MEKRIEESFKPRMWLLVVLIVIGLAIGVVLANKYVNYLKEKADKAQEIIDKRREAEEKRQEEFDQQFKEVQESIRKSNEEFDINSFNDNFEHYAGTEKGLFVINLIDEIIRNNKTNKDHIISVNYNGVDTQDEEEIRGFKSSFETITDYEVILDYDDNGYVNKVTIR